MNKNKKVIVSVTTDLVTDQRVHKVCSSLHQAGYNVLLIGRRHAASLELKKRAYACKRFNLLFNSGFLFYAFYNIRLFLFLLYNKVDVLLANDLDSLPANYLASKVKGASLVYDSHEYFTEVPELINRPRVQRFWLAIEKKILPKLGHCYTVTSKIAELYKKEYGTHFELIRNFPVQNQKELNVQKKNLIIYQGALNAARGIEELIAAMPYVNNAELWIAGSGDLEKHLKLIVKEKGLSEKVKFLGRVPIEKLKEITCSARIGVSIEKKEGLNYTYALPNKIFDYIQANVPVLYSDLVEVKTTLEGFNLGQELKSYKPKELGGQINEMLSSEEYETWLIECKKAAEEFSWNREEQVLLSIFESL